MAHCKHCKGPCAKAQCDPDKLQVVIPTNEPHAATTITQKRPNVSETQNNPTLSWNPYVYAWYRAQNSPSHGHSSFEMFKLRQDLVNVFAWAVPSKACLEYMVKTSKAIVEIGSGLGYWAALLEAMGADIVAIDWHEIAKAKWFPKTIVATGSVYLRQNNGCKDRALFLCWPHFAPNGDLSRKRTESDEERMRRGDDIGACIQAYAGDHIFFVGERVGGCTYDVEARLGFNEAGVSSEWERATYIRIPQWPGIHDGFFAYRRFQKT